MAEDANAPRPGGDAVGTMLFMAIFSPVIRDVY
jgi:hypothetical protein